MNPLLIPKTLETFSVLLVIVLSTNMAIAEHPAHFSSAEIEWNSEAKSFEVAVCFVPEDFEADLKTTMGQSVNIDKLKNLESRLKTYFAENFSIADSNGQEISMSWIGFENEQQSIWVYFEFPFDGKPETCEIENALFCRAPHAQTNFMNVKIGKLSYSTATSSENRFHQIGSVKRQHP
jgi:hypothetical protein